MSEENEDLSPWRKKFLATRMAVESIFFEKELLQPQREKLSTGLLVVGAIWLFSVLLLAQWAMRRGGYFGGADAAAFAEILRYAAYFKSEGFFALIRPELADLTLNPPLYSLAFIPVFKFITSDLNLALVLVNSVFLLLIALSVFAAVRESRPNAAGWYGAAFALALPFVQEAARRPSPELALMAFVAALYACYIRSVELAHPKWSLAFALCLSLGFYSHRLFWVYVLPLVPYIMSGLANPNARDEMFKGIFFGLVLNIPWYVFAAVAVAAGLVPLGAQYNGFLHYFRLGAASAGLPLFAMGAAALAWLYFSVFMAYENKKIVAAWFWVPYLVLAWGLRGSRPELLAPAMLSFAVAVAIMTPLKARKFFFAFVLLLSLADQGGLLPPFPAGARYPLAGLPLPASSSQGVPEALSLIKKSAPPGGGLAAVYGDAALGAATLTYAAGPGSAIKFYDEPACPSCAFAILHKVPAPGAAPGPGEKDFASLRAAPWFGRLFTRAGLVPLADGSSAEVYARSTAGAALPGGAVTVRDIALGGLRIGEATLSLSGYDPDKGSYAKASLFAPSAELLGGDIYGLNLEMKDFKPASAELSPFVPAGASSVALRSAKISSYAVERFIAERLPMIEDVKVDLGENLEITGSVRGRPLFAAFALAVRDGGVFEARPLAFSLGPVTIPPFMLRLFTFSRDYTSNPYNIRVSGLKIGGQMLELY
ncbi:MAG: glycosyltransferase family 39 protein [Elusimicrobia bacterium]|nr:glycosyltransferase family 39 protein [Elusimicrobiota bacterium]